MTTFAETEHDLMAFQSPSAARHLGTRSVATEDDILYQYRGSSIGGLLASHNLGRALPITLSADLLMISCMDHRVTFDIPEYFAFQIRTAGATPEPVFSNVAFAVGGAGVKAICVIAHTDCAMCRVAQCSDAMVDHLVEREGWSPSDARDQRILLHQMFRIEDPVRAAWGHAERLADRFPSCVVAPLLYRVDDGALLQIVEDRQQVTRSRGKQTIAET